MDDIFGIFCNVDEDEDDLGGEWELFVFGEICVFILVDVWFRLFEIFLVKVLKYSLDG